jgi:glycine reductase
VARIVHYINQFFAGVGGEDSAGSGPVLVPGAVGPGRRLAELLAPDHEIVATVWCGDDVASGIVPEIVDLLGSVQPDLVAAGPAFTSGRYGLACARVAAAALGAGMLAVASMHPDNPGLDEAGLAPVVASGEVARRMAVSLDGLAGAIRRLLAGELLTAGDGRIGKLARLSVMAGASAAERAVDLALVRLGGDRDATEIPLPRFDQVTPAAPVEDVSTVRVALVTEGDWFPTTTRGASSRPGPPAGCGTGSKGEIRWCPASGGRCTAGSPPCGPTRTRTASCPSMWPGNSSPRGRWAACSASTS